MTDRELLEKAAISADMDYDPENAWPWNPLEDDGQALRLAVKLGIDVQHFKQTERVEAWIHEFAAVEEDYGADKFSATRRAIVRAAAAIGDTL